ncbi:MAG: hypothetical protein H6704_23085 [Myxococcales bacterium]|nr:hypothetical protein [Myxococcales bacterium]
MSAGRPAPRLQRLLPSDQGWMRRYVIAQLIGPPVAARWRRRRPPPGAQPPAPPPNDER